MLREIGKRHFARHDESRGPRVQADRHQRAADDLDDAGDADHRE